MFRKAVLILGVFLMLLGTAGFFLQSRFKPARAGLLVETNPQAKVFINEEEIGATPFNKKDLHPGEVTVRLVPTALELATWTGRIDLVPGVTTVIRRDFGLTDAQSSGEILSFEKIREKSPIIAVVSSPDVSEVKIDGEIRGFTPIAIPGISAGNHSISVSQPGFLERSFEVQAVSGYKLTVVVKLAQAEIQGATAEEPQKEVFVEIRETPTGFLRVREAPTTEATEAGRVDPGKKYPYAGEDEKGDWFKIRYEGEKEGWISAKYAKKLDASGSEAVQNGKDN